MSLPTAGGKPGRDEKVPAPAVGRFHMAAGLQQAAVEIPQVVEEHQQPGGELGHCRLARAEPREAPLVLELVEEVLAVGPPAVQVDDLPAVGLVDIERGDVSVEGVRREENFFANYNSGRYGAVPEPQVIAF